MTDPDAAFEALPELTPSSGPRNAAGLPPRVLVAEDDAELRRLLATALRRAGYRVTEIRDGQELLEVLHDAVVDGDREPPDLIATDIRMPRRTGLEALTALRRIAPRMPVVIFTAFPDEETVAQAFRAGANLVLRKPFDIDDLEMAARTLIRPPREGSRPLAPPE